MDNIIEHVPGLYSTSLNLDLVSMKRSCALMERVVNRKFGDSQSITDLYKEYNLLSHPYPGFHELYFNIQSFFHTVLSHHSGRTNHVYYIQSWLNVYKSGKFIDWHTHWSEEFDSWHGFFCVDVEPDSKTSYKWPNHEEVIEVESKNNLIVLGTSVGDEHKSSIWEQDYPRITIAFDIVPSTYINSILSFDKKGKIKKVVSGLDHPESDRIFCDQLGYINHWIPI